MFNTKWPNNAQDNAKPVEEKTGEVVAEIEKTKKGK